MMSKLQTEFSRRAYIIIVEHANNRKYIAKQRHNTTNALNRAKKFNSIKAVKEFISTYELENTQVRGITTTVTIDPYIQDLYEKETDNE